MGEWEFNRMPVANNGSMKLRLELMLPSDNTTFRAAGPILQKQFAAVGVETQILEYEADYIKELMREDEYTIGAWFSDAVKE